MAQTPLQCVLLVHVSEGEPILLDCLLTISVGIRYEIKLVQSVSLQQSKVKSFHGSHEVHIHGDGIDLDVTVIIEHLFYPCGPVKNVLKLGCLLVILLEQPS